MGLHAMRAVVIAEQVIHEPGIGFGLGLGLMKVIQGFVGLFHGAERALHFALRAGRGAPAIVAARQMRAHLDVQIPHDLVQDVTAGHRTVIHRQIAWPPTEGKALVRLGGHSVEQKLESRFHGFARGTMVFLVRDPTATIHHAGEHESRLAFAGINPGRGLEVLQVRGAEIKLP